VYHSLLLTELNKDIIGKHYALLPEQCTGEGRADILFLDNEKKIVVPIELKRSRNVNNLSKEADHAVQQAVKRQYGNDFKYQLYKKQPAIGISFHGTSLALKVQGQKKVILLEEKNARKKVSRSRSEEEVFQEGHERKVKHRSEQDSETMKEQSVKSLNTWASHVTWLSKTRTQKSLEEQLAKQAREFGYDLRDVGRDGNCFFHAVADQLERQGKQTTHEELRARAIEELCNHPERYEEYCDKDSGSIEQLILNNIKSGMWENMTEVLPVSLSRAADISILIVRSDGSTPTIFRRPLDQNGTEKPKIYIGNEVGWHFQSLIPIDSAEAKIQRETLEKLFLSTEFSS
jgi:hypothetical protein